VSGAVAFVTGVGGNIGSVVAGRLAREGWRVRGLVRGGVGWADLATRQDVEASRSELKGEMAELRAELKGEMAELRGEVHSLLPRLVTANIASMIGVAGLVFAVASFAR